MCFVSLKGVYCLRLTLLIVFKSGTNVSFFRAVLTALTNTIHAQYIWQNAFRQSANEADLSSFCLCAQNYRDFCDSAIWTVQSIHLFRKAMWVLKCQMGSLWQRRCDTWCNSILCQALFCFFLCKALQPEGLCLCVSVAETCSLHEILVFPSVEGFFKKRFNSIFLDKKSLVLC